MPRSTQDILDHAVELARRFEDYEPVPGDEISVAEVRLRRPCSARARVERETADAVSVARKAGLSWRRIGEERGMSAQGAERQYGNLTGAA